MLDVGTYDATVDMIRSKGRIVQSSSDTAHDIAEVIDSSGGTTNIKTDKPSYGLSNFVNCTWDTPTSGGSPVNYYQFSFSSTTVGKRNDGNNGAIRYWSNGYIYMHLNNEQTAYWLCYDNSTSSNSLWWINMDGNGFPRNFTPIMLAMSWPS